MGTERVMRRRKSTSTLWEGVTGPQRGREGLCLSVNGGVKLEFDPMCSRSNALWSWLIPRSGDLLCGGENCLSKGSLGARCLPFDHSGTPRGCTPSTHTVGPPPPKLAPGAVWPSMQKQSHTATRMRTYRRRSSPSVHYFCAEAGGSGRADWGFLHTSPLVPLWLMVQRS